MPFTFSWKKMQEQNAYIISTAKQLLANFPLDGRSHVKVRFRHTGGSQYVIEAVSNSITYEATINLECNPFKHRWTLSRHQIMEGIGLPHCRPSRFGGFTFYN